MSCPIFYSEKYRDDFYEYRHVTISPKLLKLLPKETLLEENQWRAVGIQQSRGWVHYILFPTEPHVFPFRRPLRVAEEQNVENN